MYFLSLNTPVTAVTMALERMHVPHLLVELMELIYRFIFVVGRDRPPISGWPRSPGWGIRGAPLQHPLSGELASMAFLRAWR